MAAMFKPKQRSKRVLVVDDDTVEASFICDLLNATAHFRAEHVGDGDSAFEAWQREHHDLLIVDYVVPGMDGLELLSVLQQLNGHPVPAIMVSCKPLGEVALRSGAAAFLAKPFSMDRLLDEVPKVLGMTAGGATPILARMVRASGRRWTF
jgi:DNA-binding response OmpR family regulator